MAEIPNIVEQLRQQPGFDTLPQATREQLITDALKKAAGGSEPAPRSPTLAREQAQAAQTPWWQRGLQAASQASPELGLYSPDLVQMEQTAAEMQPQERAAYRQLMGDPKEAAATLIDIAGETAGTAAGALTSPLTGPVGPYIGGIGGSYGAQQLNEYLGLRDPNARQQLGPVDVSQDTLSWALPALFGAPAMFQQLVLKPLAKSSAMGKTAVRNAEKAEYNAMLEGKRAEIADIEAANDAMQQTHETARAWRQAEIDRQTALNDAARQAHQTREQAIKDKNTAGWQVREQAIEARQKDIDRLTAENAEANAAYESARLQAAEQRAAEEQINKDARLVYDTTMANRKARHDDAAEGTRAMEHAMEHRTTVINRDARAMAATNPAKARTMVDELPDIPTEDAVKQLYATLETTLKEHNVPAIKVTRYRAAQREINGWAQAVQKVPHGEDVQAMVNRYTKGLKTNEPFTIREIQESLSFMGNRVRLLRKRAATGAGESQVVQEELQAASRLYAALDDAMLDAAQKLQLPQATRNTLHEVRAQMLDARAAYKRRATYGDMQDFVDDIIVRNRETGEEIINPVAALNKLDSPAYATTKRFMQQTPVDKTKPDGMNMYDYTVQTFEEMIPKSMTVQQAALWYAQLHHAGDPRGKLYDFTLPRIPPLRKVPRIDPFPEQYMTQVPPAGGAVQQPVPAPVPRLDPNRDYLPGAGPAPEPRPLPEPIGPLDPARLQPVPETPPSWAQHAANLPPITSGPLAAGAAYVPQAVAGGAMAGLSLLFGKYSPWNQVLTTAMAGGTGIAMGAPMRDMIASALMKPKGQALLVKLVKERGLRIDPVMTGILTAASRHGGIGYGLPVDSPPAAPPVKP